MENIETTEKQIGKQKTIGDVKAPVNVWSRLRRYQEREAEVGRDLKLPEVILELAVMGLDKVGV